MATTSTNNIFDKWKKPIKSAVTSHEYDTKYEVGPDGYGYGTITFTPAKSTTSRTLWEYEEQSRTEDVLRLRIKQLERENKELKEFIEEWTEEFKNGKESQNKEDS